MAIWWMNYMDELAKVRHKNKQYIQEGMGMLSFQTRYHTYEKDNRKADVWLDEHGNWGCRFWENKVWRLQMKYIKDIVNHMQSRQRIM